MKFTGNHQRPPLEDLTPTEHSSYALYSSAFLGISYNAADHTSCDSIQSLVSIVFAALALEAFLNELQFLAEDDRASSGSMHRLAAALKGSGRLPPPMLRRIDALEAILPDDSDCDGWSPAKADARLLFGLRNALAHHKVEVHSWSSADEAYTAPDHELLRELHARNLIPDPGARGAVAWIDLIQTKRVAIWAYNTAAQIMFEVFRRLPSSTLAIKLRFAVERIPLIREEA